MAFVVLAPRGFVCGAGDRDRTGMALLPWAVWLIPGRRPLSTVSWEPALWLDPLATESAHADPCRWRSRTPRPIGGRRGSRPSRPGRRRRSPRSSGLLHRARRLDDVRLRAEREWSDSAIHWQGVHSPVIGSTSSRSQGIGLVQRSHVPYVPCSSRRSAPSISTKADSAASFRTRATWRRGSSAVAIASGGVRRELLQLFDAEASLLRPVGYGYLTAAGRIRPIWRPVRRRSFGARFVSPFLEAWLISRSLPAR